MKWTEASNYVKSSFLLAKAFGWTPQQVHELTMGQVQLYTQLLQDENQSTF